MAKAGLVKTTDISATPDRITFEVYAVGKGGDTPTPPEPPVEPSNLVDEALVDEAEAG